MRSGIRIGIPAAGAAAIVIGIAETEHLLHRTIEFVDRLAGRLAEADL